MKPLIGGPSARLAGMSALGHKQIYAPQKAMSALPRIATTKADSRRRHRQILNALAN